MTCDDDNLCNGISTCHEDVGQCVQDVAPVVCDDNSECTLDSCTASTGQCVFETKNCDDGNACTVGDYCDVDVGCVYANPLDNCCKSGYDLPIVPNCGKAKPNLLFSPIFSSCLQVVIINVRQMPAKIWLHVPRIAVLVSRRQYM